MVPQAPSARPRDPGSGSQQPVSLDADGPAELPPAPHHIGLLVSDLAASTDFYSRGLGATVDPTRSGPTFRALHLQGAVVLGLHTAESWRGHGLAVGPATSPQTLVAYRCDRVSEVDELAGRLEDLGAAMLRGPHDAYGQRMALLMDRDGHAVSLTHPLAGGAR